jgi:hypothetical protein
VISYNNVVPYGGGSPTCSGTGTASFQIILNEDNSFNTVVSQLSANWNSTITGALITQGVENLDGSYGYAVPGRNNADWPGITSGAQDCHTFNPAPCVFQNWKLGAAIVSTNPNYVVSPTTNTTYTATWQCGGLTCTDNVVVTVSTPTISVSNIVNSTNCTTPNGSFLISASPLPVGTTTVNYLANGVPASTNITVPAATNISQGAVFGSGTHTGSSPSFNRPSTYDCPNSFGTAVHYNALSFVPSNSGSYIFDLCTPGTDYDGYALLYQTSFNPAAPCTNFLIASDDDNTGGNCENDGRITYSLTAGVTYVLVATTYSNGVTGNYQWIFDGPGSSTIAISSPVGSATASNLAAGSYTNFTIAGACGSTYAGPVAVTGPIQPVTVGASICPAGTGTVSSSTSCGVGAPTTQTATGSGGTSNTTAYNGGTDIDIAFPALPGGATVTNIDVKITYTSSWASELRVRAVPPAGATQNDIQPSGTTNVSIGTWPTASSPVGNWKFRFRETLDDTGIDANITNITITVTYTLPSVMSWFTAATGGTAIGTGSPFNPVGVSGSGLANTNTAGTTNYYAACSASPACRVVAPFVINAASTPATSITGTTTLCVGQSTTLTRVGGTLATGSVWEWFSGSCGGTPVGTGTTITVTPTATTTYYVRASAVGTCPATTCVSTTVNLPTQGTALGNNAESATCTVNINGYIHFYHSSGRFLASINSNGQNLGNVVVTAYTSAPVNTIACAGSSWQTYALGRRYVMTPQFQPTAPVTVLFPFDQTEYTALQTAAAGNTNALDNTSSIADLKLSKYSGPLNVDNLFSNNCVSAGGNGNITLHAQTASGNTNAIIPGFSASSRYTRHSISSFSEMWLHAASSNSPLPIELTQFNGKCENGLVELKWETASENNSKKFIIEKLRNNSEWFQIGELPSKGNSTVLNTYNFIDHNVSTGDNFYRLIEESINGQKTSYDAINIVCENIINKMSVYPNPNDGEFVIEVYSSSELSNSTIQITDVSGKIIYEDVLTIKSGLTNLPINLKEIAIGTYTINLISGNNKFKPVMLVKK